MKYFIAVLVSTSSKDEISVAFRKDVKQNDYQVNSRSGMWIYFQNILKVQIIYCAICIKRKLYSSMLNIDLIMRKKNDMRCYKFESIYGNLGNRRRYYVG